MRILELPAGKPPREWGRIHGESFRGEIQRARAGPDLPVHQGRRVRVGATRCWPPRGRTCRCSSATTAGSTPSCSASPRARACRPRRSWSRTTTPICATSIPIPVAGSPPRRTTIRPRPRTGQGAEGLGGDGCSVLWSETPTGRILAQTWDMHATAIPYVMVLRVPASDDGPAATLLDRHRLPRHGGDERRAGRHRDQQPVLDRRDARRGVAGDGAARAAPA